MKRLSRTLRVLKWIGTILCVLIVLAAASTLRWMSFAFVHGYYDGAILAGGAACFVGEMGGHMEWGNGPPTGWRFQVTRFDWETMGEFWGLLAARPGTFFPSYAALTIPLWMPFVVLAIPTGVLWCRDRRRAGPGHCAKCGYSLTGNVSGQCPECGTICGSGGSPR